MIQTMHQRMTTRYQQSSFWELKQRYFRQMKQSVGWVFIYLIPHQYFRWGDRAGCQLFKSSSQVVGRCVVVKYLLEIVRMHAYHVKIPACVFLVVPAVARSHDPQLFLVESRRQDERLEITICQDTDAPFKTHAVLHQLESCGATGALEAGVIQVAHALHVLR